MLSKVSISNAQYNQSTQLIEKNLVYLAVFNYGTVALQVVWNNIQYQIEPIDVKNQPSAPFEVNFNSYAFDVNLDLVIPNGAKAIIHTAKPFEENC